MEKIFHRSFLDTIALFIFGLIIFAINRSMGFNLFYAHYYLLFVSAVSAYISYRKYAIINGEGITLYFGPAYFRKSIYFSWAEVLSIGIGPAEISWMQSYGGRVRVPAKTTLSVSALKIVLKNSPNSERLLEMKYALGKYIFPPDEAINDKGNEFIIKKEPFGGVKSFLQSASTISGNDNLVWKS